jgi:hypothetical protein
MRRHLEMTESVKSRQGIAALSVLVWAFVSVGIHAEEESLAACEEACAQAESACYADCELADDMEICEIACEEEVNACYEDCDSLAESDTP